MGNSLMAFYKLDGNAGKRAAEAVINFAEKCI